MLPSNLLDENQSSDSALNSSNNSNNGQPTINHQHLPHRGGEFDLYNTEASSSAPSPLSHLPRPNSLSQINNDSPSSASSRKAAQEATLLNRLDKLHAKHYSRITQFIAGEKEQNERKYQESEKKRTEALINSVSNNLNQTLTKVAEDSLRTTVTPLLVKALTQQLTHIAKNALVPVMVHTLKQTDGAQPSAQINQEQLAEQVVSTLRGDLSQNFKSSFASTLLPAFEASIRTMFKQINETFEKVASNSEKLTAERIEQFYKQKMTQENESKKNKKEEKPAVAIDPKLFNEIKELKSMVSQLSHSLLQTNKQLTESLQSLQNSQSKQWNEMAELRSLLSSHGEKSVPTSGAATPTNHRTEIKQLLSQKNYDAAFHKALGLGKLATVVWLCQQLDARLLMTYKLSPAVLLSLIQQLGFQFKDEINVKLTWLRECVMCLPQKDPMIAEHSAAILDEVISNMDIQLKAAQEDPNNELFDTCRVLKHLLVAAASNAKA